MVSLASTVCEGEELKSPPCGHWYFRAGCAACTVAFSYYFPQEGQPKVRMNEGVDPRCVNVEARDVKHGRRW